METETDRAAQNYDNQYAAAATGAETATCPACQATLVRGMRFCRACGYRLGEGMAEYVETVRLNSVPQMANFAPGNQPLNNQPSGNQTMSATGAPTTRISPFNPVGAPFMRPARRRWMGSCSRKGMNWMWLWIVVAMISFGGIGGRQLFRSLRDRVHIILPGQHAPAPPRSFFGADDFDDYEAEGGGAIIEAAMPGSPAEAAKLIDGDVIKRFDGRPIEDEDALRNALSETPIGKTVEIEYLRDGEPLTTTLTTISADSYNEAAFAQHGDNGFLGVSDTERVPVKDTKLYGVQLGSVSENRPADLAGLKEGDIVVEFDGQPVRTEQGLGQRIDRAKPGSIVNVVVFRNGQRMEISVKMGRE